MNNIIWHSATVTRARRESQNNHKGIILWFTGLSGSGKSTLAHAIEERLHQLNCRTFVLDGDNIRHGLCSDLGFDVNARKENIRRISEVAKLMMEAGIITLTAFISPFRSDRENARKLFPHGEFIEIYCDCSLEVCEQRDPKGLYQKARDGVIPHFTGISSPYEAPERMEAIIKTDELAIEESVEQIMKLLYERGIIKNE